MKMKFNSIIIFFLLSILIGCQSEKKESKKDIQDIKTGHSESEIKKARIDQHSFSNPADVEVKHIDFDFNVNFKDKVIFAEAIYKLNQKKGRKLILDIKDLNIHKVYIGERKESPGLKYVISKQVPHLGRAMTIDLPSDDTKEIKISYSTQPQSAALQWLSRFQTASKNHPFLFTQGQAILTRTWIPCQDSPGARITYTAKVKVPYPLMAVMSAENPTEIAGNGIYHFKMEQPIPPYLIALAVGDLQFANLGRNTGVYAEPKILASARNEFSDVQRMLDAAENLYGPYQWERYDILVLPPSFPFGGMENPRLTFATPTIIAGDRSLTALIAHELAHSWSGNLVTNATWNDFWLNEGFTVYFERRIMEELYGKEYADMLALLGYQDLQSEIEHLGHKHSDTHLKLSLVNRDPDDGMTDVAYEKGAYFLMLLEQKVGREKFDAFLKEYFEAHKFQTMTTEEFINILNEKLINPNNLNVDIEAWIYGPGIPDNCPVAISDKFKNVEAHIAKLPAKIEKSITDEWTTHEWLHFIRHLPGNMDTKEIKKLDDQYAFSHSGNSEIKAAWFEYCLNNGYGNEVLSELEAFLIEVGRRKFLEPLYGAMKTNGLNDEAQRIYKKARSNYHSVSIGTIDELLKY